MRLGGLKALVPLLLLLALVLAAPFLLNSGEEPKQRDRGPAEDSGRPELPLTPSASPSVPIVPASLTGHVESDGEPPGEGAWVMLSGLEEELRVDLDASANFAFREVPPGIPFDLWVGPHWTGTSICQGAQGLMLEPGENRFIKVSAPLGPAIEGRIVDKQGRGLEGVRVAVLPDESDWRQEVPVAATTGPDGRFYVGWRDGVPMSDRLRLVVDHVAEGFMLEERLIDPLGPGARDIVVILKPGLEIAGRVLLPDGSPLAGARVHLLEEYRSVLVNPEGWPEGEGPTIRTAWDPKPVVTRYPCEGLVHTDEEGRFRDNALRPGIYRIFVSGESGGQRFGVVKEGIIAGSENVEVRFPGFGSLKLCFEDEVTGKPVQVIQGDLEFIYGHTGEEEHFECWQSLEGKSEVDLKALPEGHYRIRVSADGYDAILSDLLFVKAGVDLGTIRYRLTPVW